jgi:hypothetical protein
LVREDSIHIKIKLDIDEEDKQIITNVSEDLAKADIDEGTKKSKRTSKKEEEDKQKDEEDKQKDIEDEKEREIKKSKLKRTSKKEDEDKQKEIEDEKESEIKKLKLKRANKKEEKDKQKDIEDEKKSAIKDLKKYEEDKQKDTKDEKESAIIKAWKEGNVGKINQLSTAHFANLRKAAINPGQYMLGAFVKTLGKVGGALTKGGLAGLIAYLVYEIVLFTLDQLMMPGRWLDRRFKRIARLETMNFYERTLQEEIRHGYQEIRVTTMEGLRGGASQVNGNLFEFSSGATGIIQSSPYRSSQAIYQSQNASGNVTDTRGNPRRRSVFFNDR